VLLGVCERVRVERGDLRRLPERPCRERGALRVVEAFGR
jgi:hypothetical protein